MPAAKGPLEAGVTKLPRAPFLYPILDSAFSKDIVADAEAILEAGVEIFQIRAKDRTKREIFDKVKYLLPACEKQNARMIINDHVDIALITGAHGVHLGQEDFPVVDARLMFPAGIIGISCHNELQCAVANSLPVDYIAIGPIYPTRTKIGSTDLALGVEFVRNFCKSARSAVVCIGGIGSQHFESLVNAGAKGIAMISALYKDGDLYHTVRQMREHLASLKGNHEEI
jgi:thiamine-phosphate pyrophosphorylase